MAYYPTRATMWHQEAIIVTGNALSFSLNTSQTFNGWWVQSTPADGNKFTNGFFLKGGSGYTLYLFGVTGSDCGKIDWKIDGTSVATGQDWYSSSLTLKVTKTITSLTISGDGFHVLEGTVNGKNASSSNYFIPLDYYWFSLSTDTEDHS